MSGTGARHAAGRVAAAADGAPSRGPRTTLPARAGSSWRCPLRTTFARPWAADGGAWPAPRSTSGPGPAALGPRRRPASDAALPGRHARRAAAGARRGRAAPRRGVAPFRVELSGAGPFRHPHRPRVLWIGIGEGEAELAELAGRLNDELAPLGWPPEGRPFAAPSDARPHRWRARGRPARAAADRAAHGTSDWPGRPTALVLYKSILGHGPARYEVLAEAPLA